MFEVVPPTEAATKKGHPCERPKTNRNVSLCQVKSI